MKLAAPDLYDVYMCMTKGRPLFTKHLVFKISLFPLSKGLYSSQSVIAQVQISFILDDRFYIDRNMALTSCISFLQVLDLNEKILNDRFAIY